MWALGSEQVVCRFLSSVSIFDKNPMHVVFVHNYGEFSFVSLCI